MVYITDSLKFSKRTMESSFTRLLPYQSKAIENIRAEAISRRQTALNTISSVLDSKNIDMSAYEKATNCVQANAKIDIHFHPERLSANGKSVADGLLADGEFRNQYETGISSGSPTAFQDGERDLWEKHLFGGAYHVEDATLSSRPKYGALEIMNHPDGASPRFGSCFLILKSEVSNRSTFTLGGSQEDDALEKTGTLSTLEPLMANLILELEKGQGAFGVSNLTINILLNQLREGLSVPYQDPSNRPLGRALDSFIEVQIHGKIDLREDVERLVADPSFKDTHIGEVLEELCAKYNILLNWHPGFSLSVAEVPHHFRGYEVKPLAHRIAGTGMLDAASIGIAANTLVQNPESWKDWGAEHTILAQFRRLWHILVLYGEPIKSCENRGLSEK